MNYKINNTEFLNTINNKLQRNIFMAEIESDLLDISKTKTIHLDNMQNLMNYLHFSQISNRHYYEGLVYLLENTNMDLSTAVTMIDEIIEEDEDLYVELLEYLAPGSTKKHNGEVA